MTYVYTKDPVIPKESDKKNNNNTPSSKKNTTQTDVKATNKISLPKTGEEKTIFGLIGVILIAFASLLNIYIKRNKRV